MSGFSNIVSSLRREAAFLAKQRYVVLFCVIVFMLSAFSVGSGIYEMQTQNSTIERLLKKDTADRDRILAKKDDYGSVAYYSFHLTYSEPSNLAFAALGQRDIYPWKHRIRMLALEGQIYETDADNPELSLLGRFDFAFLVSVLMPLFIILLLHDLRSGEREAGRYDLLIVTARQEKHLWRSRAMVLCTALMIAILLPFIVGAIWFSADAMDSLLMVGLVVLHGLFWAGLIVFLGGRKKASNLSSARFASRLLGIWLLVTVIVPVVSDTAISRYISSPKGGDIVLTQREAVNDAWDLPVSDTWKAFLVNHPEWKDRIAMNSLFEWKWYYAFQQVGDEKAAALSQAYRQAIQKRDDWAGFLSALSPSMLVQRYMTMLADTDIRAMMEYEANVRKYHADLRAFYYPYLFNAPEFNRLEMGKRPEYRDVIK